MKRFFFLLTLCAIVAQSSLCRTTFATVILLCNDNLKPGKVMATKLDPASQRPPVTLYRAPSGQIHAAALDSRTRYLYYVDANRENLYRTVINLPRRGGEPELVYQAKTYIRDVTIGPKGGLYFSHASGSGQDGAIYGVDLATKNVRLIFRVPLSEVGGYWAGDFAFSPSGKLIVSSGNHLPSQIYEYQAGHFVKRFEWGKCISGPVFLDENTILFTDCGESVLQMTDYRNPETVLHIRGARFTDVSLYASSRGDRPHRPARDAGLDRNSDSPNAPLEGGRPFFHQVNHR